MANKVKQQEVVPASKQKMEEYLGEAIHGAEKLFHSRWEKVEECVRSSPGAAVLIAAGVGHCLHRLPFRSLLAAQFRLAWALAPPALLAFAATKAYRAVEERYPSDSPSGNGHGAPAGK
jgi:hypothetical protein